VFNPPGRGRLSKIVTATPWRRSSAAQASDAGPAPTQATRWPVSAIRRQSKKPVGFLAGLGLRPS